MTTDCSLCHASSNVRLSKRSKHSAAVQVCTSGDVAICFDPLDMRSNPSTGIGGVVYNWILTGRNAHTKSGALRELQTKRPVEVVKELLCMWVSMGGSQKTRCDLGKEFNNQLMKAAADAMGFSPSPNERPGNPNESGIMEQPNSRMKKMLLLLSIRCGMSKWHLLLPTLNMNTMMSWTSSMKMQPNRCMCGCDFPTRPNASKMKHFLNTMQEAEMTPEGKSTQPGKHWKALSESDTQEMKKVMEASDDENPELTSAKEGIANQKLAVDNAKRELREAGATGNMKSIMAASDKVKAAEMKLSMLEDAFESLSVPSGKDVTTETDMESMFISTLEGSDVPDDHRLKPSHKADGDVMELKERADEGKKTITKPAPSDKTDNDNGNGKGTTPDFVNTHVLGCKEDAHIDSQAAPLFCLPTSPAHNEESIAVIAACDNRNFIPPGGESKRWGSDVAISNSMEALTKLNGPCAFKTSNHHPVSMPWALKNLSKPRCKSSEPSMMKMPSIKNKNHWILHLHVNACSIHKGGCSIVWDPLGSTIDDHSDSLAKVAEDNGWAFAVDSTVTQHDGCTCAWQIVRASAVAEQNFVKHMSNAESKHSPCAHSLLAFPGVSKNARRSNLKLILECRECLRDICMHHMFKKEMSIALDHDLKLPDNPCTERTTADSQGSQGSKSQPTTSGPVDDECDAFDAPMFERTSRTTVRHVLAGAKKKLSFGSGGPKSVVPGTDVADEKKKCDDMIKSFLDGTSCNESTHTALTSVFNRMLHINTKDALCDMARNMRCDSASFIRVNLSLSLPLHPFLSALQMK